MIPINLLMNAALSPRATMAQNGTTQLRNNSTGSQIRLSSSLSTSNIRVRVASTASSNNSEKQPPMNCADLGDCLRMFIERESSLDILEKFISTSTNRINYSNILAEQYNSTAREERSRMECEERIIKKYFTIRADEQSLRELVVVKLLNGMLAQLQILYESHVKASRHESARNLLASTGTFKEEVQKTLFALPFRFTQILRTIVNFSRFRFTEIHEKLWELVIKERDKQLRVEEDKRIEIQTNFRRLSNVEELFFQTAKERGSNTTTAVAAAQGIQPSFETRSIDFRSTLRHSDTTNEDISSIRSKGELSRPSSSNRDKVWLSYNSLNQSDKQEIGMISSIASSQIFIKKPRVFSAIGSNLSSVSTSRKPVGQAQLLRLPSPSSHSSSQARLLFNKQSDQKSHNKSDTNLGLRQSFLKQVDLSKKSQPNMFGSMFQNNVRDSSKEDQFSTERAVKVESVSSAQPPTMLSNSNSDFQRFRLTSYYEGSDSKVSCLQQESECTRTEQEVRRNARLRKKLLLFPPKGMQSKRFPIGNNQTGTEIEETFAHIHAQTDFLTIFPEGTDPAREVNQVIDRLFNQILKTNAKVKQTISQYNIDLRLYQQRELVAASAAAEEKNRIEAKKAIDNLDEEQSIEKQNLNFKTTDKLRPRTCQVWKTITMSRTMHVEGVTQLSSIQLGTMLPLQGEQLKPKLVISPSNREIQKGFLQTPQKKSKSLLPSSQGNLASFTTLTPDDSLRVLPRKQISQKKQKEIQREAIYSKHFSSVTILPSDESLVVKGLTDTRGFSTNSICENQMDIQLSKVVQMNKLIPQRQQQQIASLIQHQRPITVQQARILTKGVDCGLVSQQVSDDTSTIIYTANSTRKLSEFNIDKRLLYQKKEDVKANGDYIDLITIQQQYSGEQQLSEKVLYQESPDSPSKQKLLCSATGMKENSLKGSNSPSFKKMQKSSIVRQNSRGLVIKIEKFLTESGVREADGCSTLTKTSTVLSSGGMQMKELISNEDRMKLFQLESQEMQPIKMEVDDIISKKVKKKFKSQRPSTSQVTFSKSDIKIQLKSKKGY